MSRRWRFECAASRMVLTRTELNGRVCAHATHVIDTRGPSGDPITSIGASFRFSSPGLLEYLHVRLNVAAASRCKNDPSPPPVSVRATDPHGGPKPQSSAGKWPGTRSSNLVSPPVPRVLLLYSHLPVL